VTHPTLDAALTYADRGWRVIPIVPGQKRPALAAWQDAATSDPDLITDWFTQWPTHGVGIACGEASGIFVLDVDNAGDKVGDQVLAELEAKYGALPETYTVRTGSGGWHFYFLFDPARPIRNGKLGPNLDIRGEGGQVLAPPTRHPDTGEEYRVHLDVPLAPAPEWMYGLLLTRPEPERRVPPPSGSSVTDEMTPAQDFDARNRWEDLLIADGWTLHHTDSQGEMHWTRPGKDARDGTSATTYWKGQDMLKVFTSSVPGLDADRAYGKFGYYAATRHGGDESAAARQLRSEGYGATFDPVGWISEPARALTVEEPDGDTPPADVHGWEAVDLAGVLSDDYEPPRPELLRRTDGKALLYRGRINGLFGESGGGKSFISQRAIVEVIARHGNVLVIDLEDHVGSYIARLLAMGLTREIIAAHLTYISPELGLSAAAGTYLAGLVTDLQPDLVVIDSTGEALSIQGVKPNEDDEVARWFRMLPRAIANLGPAVLLLDHVPKSDDAPKNYAIGSQRKRAAIDGALYRVEVGIAPVKGKTGRLKLVCAKDRAGNWQHGSQVAEVTIADTADGTDLTIAEPSDPNRPTTLMVKVSEHLERNGRVQSRRQIDQGVSGKREYVVKAVDALIGEGYCREKQREGRGGGVDIELVKPFNDPVDNSWIEGSVFSAPTAFSASGHSSQTPAGPNCVFCAPRVIGHGGGNTVRAGMGALGAPPSSPNRVPQENAVSPDWSDQSGSDEDEPVEPYRAVDPVPAPDLKELF
jgi:hypothetical protein